MTFIRTCSFVFSFSAVVLLAHSQPNPPATTTSGSVIQGALMVQPRSGHTATVLPDGKVLIAGGMKRNQDFYRSAEIFDPATGKFQLTGPMTVARVGHVAVLLPTGKVLIAGGWIGRVATDSSELYYPATGTFTPSATMTAKRGNPSATLLPDGDVLIAGGADHDTPGGVSSAEIFHTSTSSFTHAFGAHFSHRHDTPRRSCLDRGRPRRKCQCISGTL